MTFSRRIIELSCTLAVIALMVAVLSGCGTTPTTKDAEGASTNPPGSSLAVGDMLTITYSDTTTPLPQFEGRVKHDGKITLMENQEFVAQGKTPAALEKEIRERYVPKYFVKLTATIRVMDLYFYVGGQVRNPSRLPYVGQITVLGAIAAANGFTDFAKPSGVEIIRNGGKIEKVDCKVAQKDPAKDVWVYPGDRVIVPRRFW